MCWSYCLLSLTSSPTSQMTPKRVSSLPLNIMTPSLIIHQQLKMAIDFFFQTCAMGVFWSYTWLEYYSTFCCICLTTFFAIPLFTAISLDDALISLWSWSLSPTWNATPIYKQLLSNWNDFTQCDVPLFEQLHLHTHSRGINRNKWVHTSALHGTIKQSTCSHVNYFTISMNHSMWFLVGCRVNRHLQ